MADLEREYLRARAEFVQIQGELHRIGDTVATVANILNSRPGRLLFKGLPPATSDDADIGKDRVEITAQDWPTAEQLQALLVRWRGARKRMLDCWHRLPNERQSAAEPPLSLRW